MPGTGLAVLHVILLLHSPLKYHVFLNIMENGAFALETNSSIFNNIIKSIQLT